VHFSQDFNTEKVSQLSTEADRVPIVSTARLKNCLLETDCLKGTSRNRTSDDIS